VEEIDVARARAGVNFRFGNAYCDAVDFSPNVQLHPKLRKLDKLINKVLVKIRWVSIYNRSAEKETSLLGSVTWD
jgi:hypothetical protein